MTEATLPATILIVDDELSNRKLLEVLLHHVGYLTVSAASGDEALALIEQAPPDLVLLDVMMPVLDGYEVARILKAHPLSLNIPIILVSSLGDRTTRLAGLTAGAEEFLTKPIDRDELWLRVRNLLRLKSDADLIRNNSLLLEERVKARTLELQRFSIAMDATADAMTLTDCASMQYIEVNAAACNMLGYTRDELLAAGPAAVFTGADLRQSFDEVISGGGTTIPQELTWRHKEGHEVSVEVNRQPVQSDEDCIIVSVARDITERKLTEARLQQLAHYDSLTGLPNRRLFQESLSKAMEYADAMELQVVLLYLDLDNFKDINDSFGHAVGDELLWGIGQRLLSTLYPRDSVGRLGGDEFGVILITPRDPDSAIKAAHRIHEALCAPFDLAGTAVSSSVSVGISLYPSDTDDAGVLARNADMAMYEAKRAGRNTSRFYTDTMNQQVIDKRQLVAALREAVSRGEFVLHYQPKVCLLTGRWMGVEALLRWERPGHGLVMPSIFIPVLEESGLIVPVGAWIVSAACSQLAEWRRRGLEPLPIAINVSAMQILHQGTHAEQPQALLDGDACPTDTDLISGFANHMAMHEIAAGLLEIEITESVLMPDAERSVEILQRLRAMGLAISVDDFGTGYSSLSYLRRFPLQSVKIDGSFIREVIGSADDASIVVAIIEMAHRLKLKVIAECVETAEQVTFLQAHDCDQAQGYYFAKPLPVEDLEALWLGTCGELPRLVAISDDPEHEKVFASAWPECRAFVAALLAGSLAECDAILELRRVQGHGLVEAEQQLIRPALYWIGEKWRSRQISVAQEHLATALAQSAMELGLSRTRAVARNGRKVLLACIPGNHHAVGLRMVADAFTLAGWEVNCLGANVPFDALVDYSKQWRPNLLGLSASLPEHAREMEDYALQLQRALGTRCPPILLGGQGFDAADPPFLPGARIHWAPDPQGAVAAGELAFEQASRVPLKV